MISKEKLLEYLKEGLDKEEKSIPIYMKHLDSAIFWAGLDQKIVNKAREAFTFSMKESIRHKEIIENLIKTIKEDTKNAY